MTEVQTNEIPFPSGFEIDGKRAVKMIVRPINFSQFAECARAVSGSDNAGVQLTRERAKAQVRVIDEKGASSALDDASIAKLPVRVGIQMNAALSKDTTDEVGSVVKNSGDGIDAPLLFKLGKPLKMGGDNPPVNELEFHARTYGDIEAIIAAPNQIEQTAELIKGCARPVSGKLLALPDVLIDQIAMEDGIAIMMDVLPNFTE